MSKRVCIDPGHAPGNANKGPTGYYEHEGMWMLSGFLKSALERCGVDVTLTRSYQSDPSLSKRGQTARDCDLFVSEHSNASNGTARGVEVYYSVQLPGDKPFAAALSKAVCALMGNDDRGAKTRESANYPGEDYYDVMKYARREGCPHVFLIESGFHDNPADEAFLKIDDNLKAIAERQAEVLCECLGVSYSPETAPPTARTPIAGVSVRTPGQLAAYLFINNPSPLISCTPAELARYYIEEGGAEGIRGDIAFCQAILETGWFGFKACDVSPEQNNFCGLGATGGGTGGAMFDDAKQGVRAHIQHLKAYANDRPLSAACVDPRFDLVARGSAPFWQDLDGKWAVPGDGYGEHILRLYGSIPDEPAQEPNAPTNGVDSAPFVINGVLYQLPRILLDGRNYVRIDSLKAAGFTILWDESAGAAIINTPG